MRERLPRMLAPAACVARGRRCSGLNLYKCESLAFAYILACLDMSQDRAAPTSRAFGRRPDAIVTSPAAILQPLFQPVGALVGPYPLNAEGDLGNRHRW